MDRRTFVPISDVHGAAPDQARLSIPCSYCTYRKIEGNTYRFSDPGQVAASAVRLASSGLRDIEFVDSVFNAPYDHAMAVCEALARANPKARFQSLELNPLYFDDALLVAMKQAGFVGIGLTVESASNEVLQGLRKGFPPVMSMPLRRSSGAIICPASGYSCSAELGLSRTIRTYDLAGSGCGGAIPNLQVANLGRQIRA